MGTKSKSAHRSWLNRIFQQSGGTAGVLQRRHFVAEMLEPRRLLSGAHDQAIVQAIDAGLSNSNTSGLAAWSSKLSGAAALGQELALIGTNFGSSFNVQSILSPILSRLNGTYNTITDLQNALGNGTGLTVNATRNNTDDIQLDLEFKSTNTTYVSLSPTFNLPFNLGGSLQLSTALDFQVTVGAYYDSAASQGVFYINAPSTKMTVSPTVSATNLSASAHLGFMDVNITNGSVTFSPTFTLSMNDPDNDSGRVTLSELNTTPISSLLQTSIAGTGPALSFQVTSSLVPGTYTINFNWPSLTSPEQVSPIQVTSTPASLATAFQNLINIDPAKVSGGLDTLVSLLADEATNATAGNKLLQTKLPLVNRSISDIVNFPQFFQNALTRFTDVTSDSSGNVNQPFTSAGALVSLLQNIPGVGAGNISDVLNGTDIQYHLHMTGGVNQSYPINLGLGSAVNLSVNGSITANLSTTTDVTFGVDSSTGKFYILHSTTPVFAATASLSTNINADTNLGFLGVHVTNGTAAMNGMVSVSLNDPNPSDTTGIITSDELTTNNLANLVSASVTGNASLSLPLSTNLGAISSNTGTLTASWTNITDPSTLSVDTSQITSFFDFNSITPQMVLQGLAAVPNLLNQLAGTSGLGHDLAFLGSGLSTIINLGNQFQGYVNNLSSITTVQGLQMTLQNLLGSNVTVTVDGNSDIHFGLTFKQTLNNNISYQISTDKNLSSGGSSSSPVSFSAGGSLQVTGSVQANLGFGITLSSTPDFYLLPGSASSFTANLSIKATNINASGKIAFITVGIQNGTATVSSAANPANPASLSLSLLDPDSDGKITLSELTSNLAGIIGPLTVDAAANVTLPITGLPAPGASPQIILNWTNLLDPSTLSVTTQGLGDLSSALNFNASTVLAGIQALLNMLQGFKSNPLLNTNIPLVNKPISALFPYADKAIAFFQQIENSGNTSTASAFDSVVQGAINAANLQQFGATLTDNSSNASAGLFDFDLQFNKTIMPSPLAFDFGSNLFALNVSLQPMVQFKANIEFGFNPTDGFYLVDQGAAAGPEINVNASLNAPITALGNFGPIQIGVANGVGNINFNANIDLQGLGGSNKITFAQLGSDLGSVVVPNLSGNASLKLPLGLRIGMGGPGVTTTFAASWASSDPTEFHFGPNNSTDPTHGFDDASGQPAIFFDPGEFIRNTALPVVQQIQKYDPITPDMVKVLETPLPLINESPAQILGDVTGSPINTLLQIVSVVSTVSTDLSSLGESGSQGIDLSQFLGTGPNGGGTAGDTGTKADNGSTPGPLQQIANDLKQYDINVPVLSDPAGTIIKLLLGQNVTLIEFNPGHVELDASFSTPEITIPIFSIGVADADVTAQVGGSIGIFANVDIGLDTRGLLGQNITGQTPAGLPQFLDGLYIGDTDRFQFGFTGEVHLDLGGQVSVFGFPIVNVYGQIGLELDLGAHLNDVAYQPGTNTPVTFPNADVEYGHSGGDGKVHLDELNYLWNTYGALCTVDPGGTLSLTGGIGFKALCLPSFLGSGDICALNLFYKMPSAPLIDFNYPCDAAVANLAQIVGNSLVMSSDSSTDGKRINASIVNDMNGKPELQIIKQDDLTGLQYQDFYLSDLSAAGVNTLSLAGSAGPDVFNIDPSIFTNSVSPFQYLQVNTGEGNDKVDLSNFQSTMGTLHLLGTTITAGSGTDTITGSPGPDFISVGNGNDQVTEFDGNDTIHAGDGNNTISTGKGNNTIVTGNGNSLISTGNGNSSVTAGGGQNTINSGTGNDTVLAGDGGDQVYAAGGNDSITTGAGADVIRVDGNGNSYINAGAGNDSVTATGGGSNTIYGGAGDDALYAGDGNNLIYGQDGNDIIQTGNGKDYIDGGTGNNAITSGNGDNKVLAGNGNNRVTTGTGQDIILLGSGNNAISSGAGDDFISVGPGANQIDGGSGHNTLEVSGDVNYTLANGSLTTSATGALVGTISNVNGITLTGGPSNNTFDVSGWTGGTIILNGGGGTDTVVSTDYANFTLTDSSLSRSDGTSFLLNGIMQAQLSGPNQAPSGGGPSDVSFDVSNFTGHATLTGGSGPEDYGTVVSNSPGSYTLTNSSLTKAGGGTFALANINHATLPTGAGSSINSAGFSGLVNLAAGGAGGSTLPGGADSQGPWAELGQSATNGGVSNSPKSAIEPAIAAAIGGQFVAWADNRNGSYQIYVAEHTASGWQQLAGSAQGGGISNTAGDSRRPAIAVDSSGNPVVAWTVFNGASSDIEAAKYDPTANAAHGGWVALGSSLSVGGLSDTGAADNAQIVLTSAGPTVAWLNRSTGAANIYAKQFTGSTWSALGSTGASGSGVSGSASAVPTFSLATDGSNVAIAWTQAVAGASQIYLLQYAGGAWNAVDGSASAGGASNSSGNVAQPSVAYHAGALFVAWQDTVNGQSNIAAATAGASSWSRITIDTPTSAGNAITRGQASMPALSENGAKLTLVWAENRLPGMLAQATELFANRYAGGAFAQSLPGQAAFNGIGQTSGAVSAVSLAMDPVGRPYVAWGDGSSGSPQIYVRGDAYAVPNVYYVAPPNPTPDDTLTTAAGASGNSGMSPSSPLDSVQSVLSKYTLAPGSAIVVDSGTYSGFTVPSTDSNFLILGNGDVLPTFSSAVSFSGSKNVVLEDLNFSGGLNLSNDTGDEIVGNSGGAVAVTGGAGLRIEHNNFASITLGGGVAGAIVVNNAVSGAVTIAGGGASNLLLSGNQIAGGLGIENAASGTITANNISNKGGTALDLSAQFTGSMDHNSIHAAAIGVNYATGELLNSNQIYGNTTGIIDTVNSSSLGLGFVTGSVANSIFSNTTGVQLTGLMQLQHVYGNVTGVTGSGTLGGATLDTANLIETNATGVKFTGTIQFNRIDRNIVGILAQSGNVIIHNLIYRGVTAGIETSGASDVRIVNNTFYSTLGDNVLVNGVSANVQVLNNIMWATGGYDLNIADDSHSGYFSDYNDLYTTGSGRIVHYFKDFSDILDWQQDVYRYDLHSIGTTVVNPTWAQPQFVNLVLDNYQVNDLVSGQRSSSPTVDGGDPITDIGLPPNQPTSRRNLLADPGFESATAGWTISPHGGTVASNPAPFDGAAEFTAGGDATAFATQTIDLAAAGFDLSSIQNNVAVFGGRIRWNTSQPGDSAFVQITFLDSSGTAIGIPSVAQATNTTDRWELVGGRQNIPSGTHSIRFRFEADRASGNNDSVFDGAFLRILPSAIGPDQGAYGDTADPDTANSVTHIALRWPDLYTNWDLAAPHTIQWESFNNSSQLPVKIDLYQNGAFLLNITPSTPDNGQFSWIPQYSGLTAGTFGLTLQVSLVGLPQAADHGTETFAIPQAGNNYYVNGTLSASDFYATASGNNRNTGKVPGAPLPLLTTALRTYALGAGNTVFVDTGNYYDFNPVVIDGTRDAGVTITGPTNANDVATLRRDYVGSAGNVIEVTNGATAVQVSHFTLIGSQRGIWVHNGSIRFQASYITTSNNTAEGIRLESDAETSSLDHITATNNNYGIAILSPSTTVNTSTASNNTTAGIYAHGARELLSGNVVSGNGTGMDLNANSSAASDQITASGNTVSNNTADGIDAYYALLSQNNVMLNGGIQIAMTYGGSAVGNTIQGKGSGTGLSLYDGPSGVGNVIFACADGIVDYYGTASGNRVYDNTDAGILLPYGNGTVSGNHLYSNGVGIKTGTQSGLNGVNIANNLIYGDSIAGVWLSNSTNVTVSNNTIQESGQDAVRLSSSSNVSVKNNLLWTMGSGGYDLNVASDSQVGFASDYNDLYFSGSGHPVSWQGLAYPTLSGWSRGVGFDGHSLSVDPQFNNPAGADGVLGYDAVNKVDRGQDDDFTLKAGSPAIQAGDLGSYYLSEPQPNGARIDMGAYGNTSRSTPGAAQELQVLSPKGLDNLSVGTPTTVQWRSFGLDSSDPVALMDAGGVTVDNWLADAYQTTASNRTSFTQAVDVSNVAVPAPQQVYQSVAYANGGVGNELSYQLPVPDGSYMLKLEFAEGFTNAVGQRVFDIKVNGTVVKGSFDVYAAAGGQFKAVEESFPVTASGGTGVKVELVNDANGNSAELSGLGLWRANGLGVAAPKVDLQVSLNGGAFSTIASGLTMDAYGRGSYMWTPAAGGQAVLRAVSENFPSVSGSSAGFSIGSGNNYYVNDGSTVGDEYATAVGNDANDGRSPGTPMASLAALLAAYPNIGTGATVYVDSGSYALAANVVIGAGHSGLTIQGPVKAGDLALLNRGNTAAGSYGIEVAGATHLTLNNLAIGGAADGIHTDQGSLSSYLSVSGSQLGVVKVNGTGVLAGNAASGLFVDSTSDHAMVNADTASGNVYGFNVQGPDETISASTASSNTTTGIYAHGVSDVLSGNVVSGNGTGMDLNANSSAASDQITASGNTVSNNTADGIDAYYALLSQNNVMLNGGIQIAMTYGGSAVGNTIQGKGSGTGLSLYDGPSGVGNVIFACADGIVDYYGTASGNRVYDNTDAGILLPYGNGTVSGNHLYSNGVGIKTGTQSGLNGVNIANNLIYGDSIAGVWLSNSTNVTVSNNTIQESGQDAVRLSSSSNVSVKNNLLWTMGSGGYDLNVASDSQVGFASDYNDLYFSGSGHPVSWQGLAYPTLSGWSRGVGFDGHSLSVDPQFNNPAGADGVLGYDAVNKVDRGQDDDFTLKAGSPAIQAGDLGSYYLSEPQPNGARIDMGAYGNTSRSTPGAAQELQVLSPKGLDNLSVGTPTTVQWRSFGLDSSDPVALMDAGGVTVDNWLADAYQTTASNRTSFTQAVDVSNVAVPAPQQVYQSVAYANGGVGNELSYQLPVPDGSYMLKLEFAEGFTNAVGQRVFDIKVNGTVVKGSFDVYAAAGGQFKAVEESFPVTASGGTGVKVELVNDANGNSAELSGLGLWRANGLGVAAPKVDLQVSLNGGAFSTIASGLTMDAYGRGSYMWTPAAGGQAVLRAVSENFPSVSGSSAGFSIGSGNNYYVNDGSTVGDEYATAVGNDANDGRSPGTPMASLAALLAAYPNIGTGATVYVDSGSYALAANVVIGAGHSGLTIQGPVKAGDLALLNRGNTAAGSYGIEVAGATHLTLNNLAIGGAADGIHTDQGSLSSYLSVSGSQLGVVKVNGTGVLAGNAASGLFVDSTSDHAMVNADTASGNVYGFNVQGPDETISASTASSNTTTGIYAHGVSDVLSGNVVSGNGTGMDLNANSSAASDQITASGNTVSNNTADGIDAYYALLSQNNVMLNGGIQIAMTYGGSAVGNTIQGKGSGTGLSLYDGPSGVGNVIFACADGIVDYYGTASGNRVYDNTDAGILLPYGNGTVSGNHLYSNGVGIKTGTQSGLNGVNIANNLIYGDSIAGVWLSNSTNVTVSNNTIQESGQDAVRLSSSSNVSVKNNLLWTMGSGGYDLNVASDSQVGFASDYNDLYFSGSGHPVSWQGLAYPTLSGWSRGVGFDGHSLSVDPQFNNPAGADGVLGYDAVNKVDRGQDDDFTLKAGSPAIQAGDLGSYYLSEPQPNGARIDMGAYGNTSRSTPGAAQELQVLSPKGLDNLSVGTPTTVQWRSFGLDSSDPVALMDAGGVTVDNWLADAYQTTASNRTSFTQAVDVSNVAVPAPQQVYQSVAYANGGVGNELSYQLPVPDGSYMLKLEFAEGFTNAVGQRVFDIKVNGTVVKGSFDVYAAAGGQFKAVEESFPVTASGGTGVKVELVNDANGNSAELSGLGLWRANGLGVAAPKVDLQVSLNGGAFSTIASGLTMDAYGRGSYMWTPAAGGQAVLRAVSENFPSVSGSSAGFSIGSGNNYYVNDGSTVGDEYATAVGNDANDGRSPGTPMASLAALLAAYPNIGTGATVYVDSGSYALAANVVIGAGHSGLTIQGPVKAGDLALLNRGNTAAGSYGIEVAGATHLTLNNLAIGGAADGIHTDQGSLSSYLSVSGSQLGVVKVNGTGVLAGNAASGLFVDSTSDHAMVNADTASGNVYGFNVQGPDETISASTASSNTTTGIYAHGVSDVLSGNVVSGNGTGMDLNANSSAASDQITASGNTVSNNTADGIDAYYALLSQNNVMLNGGIQIAMTYGGSAVGNTIQGKGSGTGLSLYDGPSGVGNVIFACADGIVDYYGTASGNRVYDNTDAGILLPYGNGTVSGNHLYSNGVGIKTGTQSGLNGVNIANNLIYSNVTQGLLIANTTNASIVNNTIYQPAGDVIRIQSSSNLSISNNILKADGGYDLYVASDSQSGFNSNYNDLFKGTDPRAQIGFWNGAPQGTIGNWQATSSQDSHSISADPLWVDPAGADNVLGYNTVSGYDGGADDNFFLSHNSPAIDIGNSWSAWHTDIEGSTRFDDPGTANSGSSDYKESNLGSSSFASGGTAQNWRYSGSTYWSLNLPFAFPFYGNSYSSVYVCSQGLIQFGGTSDLTGMPNGNAALAQGAIIAPLWASLRTDQTGNDIFVDTSTAGQVTIRWNATNTKDSSAANFSVTLFQDGHVRFDYGAGNTNLSPTIGISSGNGQAYVLSGYNGTASLTNASSVQYNLMPGIVDLGAYEFRGSSTSTTPPLLTATTPSAIQAGGSATAVSQIRLTFSEALNDIDANAVANYQLIGAGTDGQFGTADDVYYSLTPSYAGNATTLTLNITGAATSAGIALPYGGQLPAGQYRLTVYSNPTGSGLHDLSGLKLDGDANGTEGGNYVRVFTTTAVSPHLLSTTIGNGTAQRSEVRSITLKFDQAVALGAGALTLSLLNTGGSGLNNGSAATDASAALGTPTTTDGGLTWIIPILSSTTYSDSTGSLKDGIYTVTINPANVTGGILTGTNLSTTFHRLYGDIDGNKTVNSADYFKFKAAFGSSNGQANFNADFDVDGNGKINSADYFKFKANFGRKFTY